MSSCVCCWVSCQQLTLASVVSPCHWHRHALEYRHPDVQSKEPQFCTHDCWQVQNCQQLISGFLIVYTPMLVVDHYSPVINHYWPLISLISHTLINCSRCQGIYWVLGDLAVPVSQDGLPSTELHQSWAKHVSRSAQVVRTRAIEASWAGDSPVVNDKRWLIETTRWAQKTGSIGKKRTIYDWQSKLAVRVTNEWHW